MSPPARRRGLRAIRRGHSPNCSATGSVVGMALVSATALAMVVNAFADRFWQWADDPSPPDPPSPGPDREAPPDGAPEPPDDPTARPRIRYEGDGSLLAWPRPPALLKLDPEATAAATAAGARPVGRPASAAPDHALTAPVEVHVSVTAACPVQCTDCYLDAGPDRPERFPDLDRRLTELAELGVFEVALGGGEGLVGDPEGLLDTASRIRGLGMVPNLTTSGFGMTAALAQRLRVMGQVNISLDGLSAIYRDSRGFDGTRVALRAIDHLVAAGVRVGVNTVVSRANADHLPALARTLVAHGVSEWQWLRLKPAGRATRAYASRALTPDQAAALWPLALELDRTTPLDVRFDCALVPFLVSHGPPLEHLEALAVSGCPGGIGLLSLGADGQPAPCSFAHDLVEPVGDQPLAQTWDTHPTLDAWRARSAAPPEPCASCDYRTVCRGGCRVVSAHLTGDPLAADPECPRVRELAW